MEQALDPNNIILNISHSFHNSQAEFLREVLRCEKASSCIEGKMVCKEHWWSNKCDSKGDIR